MSTDFPTSLDNLTNPTSGDTMDVVSHADQHADKNDAVEALEAKVGIDSSAVTSSHDYKLSGVTGSDKAVSKTGSETLTNKTLTTPTIGSLTNAQHDHTDAAGGGSLGVNTVDSDQYVDGSIDTVHIADDQVTPAKWTNPYRFRVSRSTDQSVTTATQTQVNFDGAHINPNSIFNLTTDEFEVPIDGDYLFGFRASFANLGVGDSQWLYILKNSTIRTRHFIQIPVTNYEQTGMVTDMISLTTSDTVEFNVYHNFGSNRNLQGGSAYLFAWGYLVGQA